MNGMNFKPFIHKVLDSLSDENIATLSTLIDSHSNNFKNRSLKKGEITNDDKGVGLYTILLDDDTIRTGYLIYNDTYCVLLGYVSNSERVVEYSLNLTQKTYEVIKEYLTTDYLRQAVKIKAVAVGENIKIQPDDIETGEAVAGLLLVTDGTGSTTIASPEETLPLPNLIEMDEDDFGSAPSNEDWLLMNDLSRDCVLKVTLSNDTEIELHRVSSDDTYINFGATVDYPNNDTFVTTNYSARFSSSNSAFNVTEIEANKDLSGSNEEFANLSNLTVGGETYLIPNGGSSIDSDVTVEIESDYNNDSYVSRTNYAEPISLQEFCDNCENGLYTNAGTIAKINNLLNNKAFRLILIGNNHEVLAYDDTTQAKTTWQFLDMPEHNVRLGLSLNVLDWTTGSGRAYLKEYLDGTNTGTMELRPSNMDGLIAAQGLLEVSHVIFEELPDTLKRHIKTVRRYYYRKRNYMSVAASGGAETNNSQMCQLACNIFHLAGTDLGTSGQSGEGSGSLYPYFNSPYRRIRFYNNNSSTWWTASPYTSNSSYWYRVGYGGIDGYNDTHGGHGVAPAFCL